MGQRYRFTFTENGDVLDPSQWVEDNNELASEFNGYLDRDNFARNDIAQTEIQVGAFTEVFANGYGASYTPDKDTLGWQGGAGVNANGIYLQSVPCPVDCLLVIEVSLSWIWANAGVSSKTGAGPTGAPWTVSTFATDTIQFRVLVDGVEVARSGFFDDTHQYYGTFLVGDAVVTSGAHRVSVECAVGRRRWEGLSQRGSNTNDVSLDQRYVIITQEKR
jgi:hypothetical protein